MKISKLMLALAAVGAIGATKAEEQHPLLVAGSSTTLSGYIDTSAIYQIGNDAWPTGAGGSFRAFDGPDKWDGFNLNVVKLSLEKPLDEGQWSAGYKVDLLFGPDANYYGSLLNGGGASDFGVGDDFAIKQAYVVARVPAGNGIDVKMGVFDTIIGYEVFESLNNPNYSRSYGFGLEPTHHTGVLASYHVSDAVSLSAGIANTYSGPINNRLTAGGLTENEELTYLGSITLTLPEGAGPLAGSAIYAGVVDGIAGAGTHVPGVAQTQDTTSYYAGTTLATPWEALNLGAAFDYQEDGFAADSWAWAAAGYASFGVSEALKLNARGEYAKGGAGSFGLMNLSGRENELLGVTVTADYALWTGLLTRLEGRWDRSLNGSRYGTVQTDRNLLTVALNMVYKF
ncbi:MAG TPA: outer membrane beta-barrel protein [Methylomirabilota bacterium]|nr:outer membrane beta-barrel protein [Methylomirabilota bacterium]